MRTLSIQPPPLPSNLLAEVTSPSGRRRAEQWLESFRDLCDRTDALPTIHRELIAALTSSVVSTRVADVPDAAGRVSKNGWHYELLPDAMTRITAARVLLSYLAGLAPSQNDIRVAHVDPGSGRALDVVDQLAELEAIGVTAGEILQDVQRRRSRGEPIQVETAPATEGS